MAVAVAARATGRTTASNTTSHAITLPTGISAGDLLLVIFSCDGNRTISVNTGVSGTNWTIGDSQTNGTIVTGAWVWKIAEGSDALTLTSSGAEQSSHVSLRITGHDTTAPIDGTSANGSSTNSNPPSHTPANGSQDYLWIATRSGDSTVVATAAPSGYSNLQTQNAAGTGGASTNTAEKSSTASSEDPATFTSASEQWVSYTLAISPPIPVTHNGVAQIDGTSSVAAIGKLTAKGIAAIDAVSTVDAVGTTSSPGSFDPTTYGNVVYWLDAQVSTSLKKTGGATAGNGENVETWEDQSTTAIDAIQTTSAAQPVLNTTGINGHPALQGASGDFFLADAPALFRNKSAVTVALVFQYSDSGTAQGFIQQWTANGTFNDRVNMYINSSDRFDLKCAHPDTTTAQLNSDDTLTDTNVYVAIGRYDFTGNEGSLWLDGTEVHTETTFGGTSNTSDTQASDNTRYVAIMATDKDGTNTNRSLVGEIVVWDELLTDTECGNVSTDLAAKWAASGGTTHSGIAQIDGVSTVVTSGTLSAKGVAQVDATSSVAAVGKLTASGVAAIDSVSTVSAVGKVYKSGVAAIDAASTVTVSGKLTASGIAAVDAVSTVSAAGIITASGVAQVDSVSTVSAQGKLSATGQAAIAGSSTVTAAGSLIARSSAAIAATSTVTAAGQTFKSGVAAIGATSTVTASGTLIARGVAAIDGVSTVSAVGKATYSGVATVTSTSAVSAVAKLTARGVSAINAQSTVDAIGQTFKSGVAQINSVSTVSANAELVARGVASINAASSVTAQGKLTLSGVAIIAATSTVEAVAVGATTHSGVASINATSSVSTSGKLSAAGVVAISGGSTVESVGKLTAAGVATIASTSTVTASATRTVYGIASIAAQSVVSSVSKLSAIGQALIAGASSVASTAQLIARGVVSITAQSSITTVGDLIVSTGEPRFSITGQERGNLTGERSTNLTTSRSGNFTGARNPALGKTRNRFF